MKFRLICGIMLFVLLSVSCSTATPTNAPTPEIATPMATPEPIALIWNKSIFFDQQNMYTFSNPDNDTKWDNITNGKITIDRDIRWNIEIQIEKLTEDIGDASTGIYIVTPLPNNDRQSIFLGYQSGSWHLGYAPSGAEGLTVWETLRSPTELSGKFTLSITSDGKKLELMDGDKEIYSNTFSERLFEKGAALSAIAQIGPQTGISITSYSLEEKPQSNEPISQIPSPASTVSGENSFIIHVSPDGNDSNTGSADSPLASISQAQQMIRRVNTNMTGPIHVILHGGNYFIPEALEFSENDSGQNGYPVIYEAAEGETPILTGGKSVTGWQKVSDSNLWFATLAPETEIFRQLYINGVHATRAAMDNPIVGTAYATGEFGDRDGIIVKSNAIPDLSNPENVELHWIYDWKDMRLKVANIQTNKDGTKTIWMQQPSFTNALAMQEPNYNWYPDYKVPFYIENALELVSKPGQWYYDQNNQVVYYYPLEGEDMTVAQVIIPQTQNLLEVRGGGIGHELHDLTFKNITFAYTNWNLASINGTFGIQAQYLLSDTSQNMTPAHINLSSVKNINFEADQFIHMGAAAIDLGNNVTNTRIIGNLFYDIADTAVIVGSWEDAELSSPLQVQPQQITISNNLIDSAGSEYRGASGINAYYVANVQFLHNELNNLPYTGISLGWGWLEKTDSTTCHDNTVAYNLITNYAQVGRDAGGIYTLGQQPGTMVNDNVFRNMKNDYACLYPDAGSAYITFTNNVCDSAPYWVHVFAAATHDLIIENTYSNVSRRQNLGAISSVSKPILVTNQNWPEEANLIIAQAGLETDYAYLRDWLSALK